MDAKVDKDEVHGVIQDFTQDQTQKSFAFRKELFEKIKDIETDITQSVAQFVQTSDLNRMLDEKADLRLV